MKPGIRKIKFRRRSRQRASALGEGAYGCVISPAYRSCGPVANRKFDSNYVAKYFGETDHAFQEIGEYRVMEQADPNGDFTIKLLEHCGSYTQVDKDVVAQNCSIVQNPVYKLIIEMGGDALSFYQLKAIDKEDAFKELLTVLLPIFRGLVTLKSQRVAHSDIKPANIVVKNDQAKLIDYGLTTTFDRILTEDFYKDTNYWFWPKDLAIMDSATPEEARDMFFDLQRKNLILNPFALSEREAAEVINYSRKNREKVAETWDTYNLGVAIFNYLGRNNFRGLGWSQWPTASRTLIGMMINPNVRSRSQPDKVLAWVKRYLRI